MRKLIIILILFPYTSKSQDPSFSQYDLNMMYSNPAFTGYEGSTKILLHSRNQWNDINENFNNSMFEFSSRIKLNKNSKKMKTTWGYGISLISEDMEVFPELSNSVFINKKEISIMPFTLEMKITSNSYLSASPLNITFRKYDLETSKLVFSDMIDDFGNRFSLQSSSFNPDLYVHNDWISDLSFGIIYTRHGKYQHNTTNRINLGIAAHHILSPIESLSENNISDSKIPTKITMHSEFYSAIPAYTRPFIRYFRIMFKHENYFKSNSSIITKTESGSTIFLNNTNLELGTLFRLNKNLESKIHLQSWVPVLRYRIKNSKHLYILSYSYDANISSKNDDLQFINTGTTHEIGFIIHLYSGNGKNSTCAAFGNMEKNPLYQDIMNNGLMNKGGFK